METLDAVKSGWTYASQLAGADAAAHYGDLYIGRVEEAIKQLEDNINRHNYRNLGVGQFKGYVAEEWAAGSFNVDAVAAGSKLRAEAVRSTDRLSVDMRVGTEEQLALGQQLGHGVGKEYSSKVYATGADSAIEQNPYTGMKRYVSSDQLEEARAQALKTGDLDTYNNLTDKIEKDGISSVPKTKADYEKMAEAGREQEFKAKDYKLTTNSAVKPEYIMKRALKAGYTAAAITVAMQLTPDIIKIIDHLIRNGEIDLKEVQKTGLKALSAGTEGFLRGSITCSIQIICDKGVLGQAFMHIDPTLLASIVSLTLDTAKNAILVAAGKMTAREMGDKLVDNIFVTTGFIVGCRIGSHIGGVIGQAIGFEIPVVGYLLGSLIGCALAAGYNISKKCFISFCVDTGFTCFGLVEQNYELPEEVLNDLGIVIAQLEEAQLEEAVIEEANLEEANLEYAEFEPVKLTPIRRGIIGVNKVGYVS